MAVNLVKGQNTVLNMNVFHVGLGWDVNEGASQYEFDLDVAAFMIGSNIRGIKRNVTNGTTTENSYSC